MTAIYLAGKVSKTDWRHQLVTGLRCALDQRHDDRDRRIEWPILRRSIQGWADYTGPFFMSDDHGCYHSPWHPDETSAYRTGSHGVAAGRNACGGAYPGMDRLMLVGRCFQAIKNADVVFAWVDEPDCYGTLCEVGWAVGRGKTVYTAAADQNTWTQDMWFVREMADHHIVASTPIEAFNIMAGILRGSSLLDATESPIERTFLEAVLKLNLPELAGIQPAYKVNGGRYRLDFALPAHNLGVELDGYEYHSSKEAFTNDRRRERELRAMGWDIIRFSGSEIHQNVEQCVRDVLARVKAKLAPITNHVSAPTGAAAEARRRLQARGITTTPPRNVVDISIGPIGRNPVG